MRQMNETGFETYYIKGKYKKCHSKREITKGELHFYKLNNCQRKKLDIVRSPKFVLVFKTVAFIAMYIVIVSP